MMKKILKEINWDIFFVFWLIMWMSNINHTKCKYQNTIEVLISMALIDSCISEDEFVLVNVFKEYDDMKEEI